MELYAFLGKTILCNYPIVLRHHYQIWLLILGELFLTSITSQIIRIPMIIGIEVS